MNWLDGVYVAFFCALMVGVGAFYSRRTKSSDRYFGNDRTTSWWMAGISFYMNSFSALGFVVFGCSFVWPELRQTVVMFPITSITTILFLMLGTRLSPDTETDRRSVVGFFKRLCGNS